MVKFYTCVLCPYSELDCEGWFRCDTTCNCKDSYVTPKRVEKFEEIAKYVKVSSDNKLGLDCKTRWNSTYKMLNAALPYESAFNRATRVEKLYDCAPSKKIGHLLERWWGGSRCLMTSLLYFLELIM